MSVQAISWALTVKTGSPSAKVVLLAIANYADASGVCWPSQELIADQTEQSIDSVQRRIKELEDLGLLVRKPRRRASTVYQLLIPGVASGLPLVDETPQTAVSKTKTPQTAVQDTAPSPQDTALVRYEPSLEPSKKEPSKKDIWPADFAECFWREYPPGRKTSKTAVFAKLEKIRRGGIITFELLMAGVRRYAQSGTPPEFTKGPLVWLNGGCWHDEIIPRRNGGQAKSGNAYARMAAAIAMEGQTEERTHESVNEHEPRLISGPARH